MRIFRDTSALFSSIALSQQYTDRNFLETLFIYVLSVSDVSISELAKTMKSIPPGIIDEIMTTYNRIKEEGE